MNIEGIKILNENHKYCIWKIDEEYTHFYSISNLKDRSIVTTINKHLCYCKDDDPKYLYADRVIPLNNSYNFAFANFKTITLE